MHLIFFFLVSEAFNGIIKEIKVENINSKQKFIKLAAYELFVTATMQFIKNLLFE